MRRQITKCKVYVCSWKCAWVGACARPYAWPAPAATDTGSTTSVKCQCRWEYALDGRLRKATRMAGIRNFRAADHGLVPISVGVWGRFLFLHLGECASMEYIPPCLRRIFGACQMV